MADSVEDLDIWQDAVQVVSEVYSLTKDWPNTEKYGLISQARRAAVSMPANIAEGVGRGNSNEIAHFAKTALGSLYELDTHIYLSNDLGHASDGKSKALRQKLTKLSKQVSSFIKYHENQDS